MYIDGMRNSTYVYDWPLFAPRADWDWNEGFHTSFQILAFHWDWFQSHTRLLKSGIDGEVDHVDQWAMLFQVKFIFRCSSTQNIFVGVGGTYYLWSVIKSIEHIVHV